MCDIANVANFLVKHRATLTSRNISELACLEQSNLSDFSAGVVPWWHVGKEEAELGFVLLRAAVKLNVVCVSCAIRYINFLEP